MDDTGSTKSLRTKSDTTEIEDAWLEGSLEMHARTHDVCMRNEIARRTSWIAVRSARRFYNRGEPLEDLVQVANIGLLKAIDRFDPHFGLHFGAYATPTIMGELRRHFRDYTWSVHVPRPTKDLRTLVAAAKEELASLLGHLPNTIEISTYLDVTVDSISNVLNANNAYRSFPLERMGIDRADITDPGFEDVLNHEVIADLLNHLPPRQRLILYFLFFEQMSQEAIATRIGISQVHVGRLIASSLDRLRRYISPESALSDQ